MDACDLNGIKFLLNSSKFLSTTEISCDYVFVLRTVADLAKDGSYAGNDVIVAVSRCYGIDVVIHQLAMPNWEVRSPLVPHTQPRRLVHLVYLRGEHYCSVRPLKTGQSSSSQVNGRSQTVGVGIYGNMENKQVDALRL